MAVIPRTTDSTIFLEKNSNDSLEGSLGDDRLQGGFQNDSLDGNSGDDRLQGGFHDDSLDGNSGDDRLQGGFHDDSLDGGSGDDSLQGDYHDDVLYGGSGDDLLDGGFHDDMLYGGSGNDSLSGESGYDTLVGGDGADNFVFTYLNDVDIIADFNAEQGDKIIFDAATKISEIADITVHVGVSHNNTAELEPVTSLYVDGTRIIEFDRVVSLQVENFEFV